MMNVAKYEEEFLSKEEIEYLLNTFNDEVEVKKESWIKSITKRLVNRKEKEFFIELEEMEETFPF